MRAVVLSLLLVACGSTPQRTWYATYEEPCGLLAMARTPDGPFQLVQPSGEARPQRHLHRHVLREGRFVLEGFFSGRTVGDIRCGAHPEFVITAFAPWGPVRRVFTAGGPYLADRPSDHYVAEDFLEGPSAPLLGACAAKARTCAIDTVEQPDAEGHPLCCSFL
jgi:hypothetical protein